MRARLPILTLLLVLLSTSCQRNAVETRTVGNPPVKSASTTRAQATAGNRPVHPYSVVSGGISSPEEMATAVKDDAVVGEHYAGLVPASFKVEKLPADRQGYVSYRVRDKILWSKRMMTLKKGEVVLTDGATMLRGRCGNRVSAIPMAPVAVTGEEPEEVVLDSFQEWHLLAGIPPVPEASPVGGTLVFTRYPDVSHPDSLLISPGSSYGLFLGPTGMGSYIPFGGGGTSGGGGGGGGTLPPSVGGGPFTAGGPFSPPTLFNPSLITYVPPALTPGLPPVGPYGTPQPYVPPTPTLTAPPTSELPPSLPPISVFPPTASTPPTFRPPPTWPPASPPLTPPNQPPGTPPTLPPGTDTPPPFSPPPVLNPPPPDTSVPEPSTFLMVAGALAAYGASRYFLKR